MTTGVPGAILAPTKKSASRSVSASDRKLNRLTSDSTCATAGLSPECWLPMVAGGHVSACDGCRRCRSRPTVKHRSGRPGDPVDRQARHVLP